MKKWIPVIVFALLFASCDNEPKLNQQEETAVENQFNSDQKSMDSLEAAIKAQMDQLDADSAELDSL